MKIYLGLLRRPVFGLQMNSMENKFKALEFNNKRYTINKEQNENEIVPTDLIKKVQSSLLLSNK